MNPPAPVTRTVLPIGIRLLPAHPRRPHHPRHDPKSFSGPWPHRVRNVAHTPASGAHSTRRTFSPDRPIFLKAPNSPVDTPTKKERRGIARRVKASRRPNRPRGTMRTQHRGDRPVIARMVLVGLVAALGISVQAWTEIRLCLEAVHSWTATQLAAWDAPARNETWPIVVAPPPELRRPVREPIIPDESTSGV